MIKYDIVYGIDPDVDGDGVARLHTRERTIHCARWKIGELVGKLQEEQKNLPQNGKLIVVVEGGWLINGNWHLNNAYYISANKAAEIGRSAGRNHQRGMDIVELLEHHSIPYMVIKPLKKIWKGRDGKITHDELKNLITCSRVCTNLKGRSNQEERDAALIALEYSGIPLRVMPYHTKKTMNRKTK